MPAPGDQHTYVANPYVDQPQRISEFTAQEVATLQARLDKQLGPEYLSSRSGPGGVRLQYISADKCINLANEVFGFNGWSSSIQYIHVDFEDIDPKTEKVSLGVTVIVRVTLRDGTYHEDVGFGQIDNCKSKATAYEKAKKEGTTDALKRALRQFGNVLGNCIYDKTYLQKIARVKAMPARFDESALHRHPDFVPKPAPESAEAPKDAATTAQPENQAPPPKLISADSFDDFLGELDEADFNIPDDGFPDMVIVPPPAEIKSEMAVDQNAGGMNGNRPMPPPPVNQFSRAVPTNNNPPRQPPQQPAQQPPRPNNSNNFQGAGPAQNGNGPRPPGGQFNQPGQFNQSGQFNQNRPTAPAPTNRPSPNPNPQAFMTPQRPGPNNQAGPDNAPQSASFEDSGFFSARGVKVIGGDDQAQIEVDKGRTFNPKAEAKSIPKTPGIDHTKSKPVSKSLQHVAPKVSEGSGDGAAPSNNKPGGPGMVPPGQQARPQPAMAGNGGPRANVNGVSGGGPRPGPVGAAGPPRPANVVNPQLDQTRRIGAPGTSSPLSNRGQFRPPTVKRAAVGADGPSPGTAPGGNMNGGNRVPLADVPAYSVVGGSAGNPAGDATGRDFKRQRTS